MKAQNLPDGQFFVESTFQPVLVGRKIPNYMVYFSRQGRGVAYAQTHDWHDVEIEQIDFPTTLQLLAQISAQENAAVPEITPEWTALPTLKHEQWFVTNVVHGNYKNVIGKVFGDIFVYLDDDSPYWGNKTSLPDLKVIAITKSQAILQALNLYLNTTT